MNLPNRSATLSEPNPPGSTVAGKTVLVVGGNGFIGCHLTATLVRAGARVRVMGRSCSPGVDGEVEYIKGDIAGDVTFDKALAGVDQVYHLVSSTIPGTSNANPIFDIESNLIGTLKLLNAMLCAGVRKLVFLSSGGTVYGNPEQLPVREDHPLRPISSYGVVKVAIENYMRLYARLHSFDITVLRLSNPYGSGKTMIGTQGVIPTLFSKIANGDTIEIWGDGGAVRDYIHLDDAINAMLAVDGLQGFNIFNVGSGVGHSLREVIDQVTRITGLKAEVKYGPGRPFDVQAIYLDINKIRGATNWEPGIDLETGCQMYWDGMHRQ
jgi:UDP-glucose 4-epimerase